MIKKVLGVFVLSFLLISCTDSGSSTRLTVDSTVKKLDSVAEKIGEKAEQGWDSVKAKAKDVKESLDETFDKKKDSTKKNSY